MIFTAEEHNSVPANVPSYGYYAAYLRIVRLCPAHGFHVVSWAPIAIALSKN